MVAVVAVELVNMTTFGLIEENCAALKGIPEAGVFVGLQLDVADSVVEGSVGGSAVRQVLVAALIFVAVAAIVAVVAAGVVDVTIPGPVGESYAALEGSHDAGVPVGLPIDIADSVVEDCVGVRIDVGDFEGLADKVVVFAAAVEWGVVEEFEQL